MINVLDKSIFNLIAAGEVVERPASVVKELVENSIDAGATEITIEISEGGKRFIKVVDNGCGILYEDISKAFLPHATSKISCASDLDAIGTLGFRGEALSSIAAVSKVTVISKPEGSVFGGCATIVGGEMSDVFDMGFKTGTCVLVEDLFFNVPARQKFLKSNRSETMEITSLVSRLILSNPNISIKYISEDSTVLFSGGSGLKDAILAVYGRKTLENLINVECTISDIVASGFVGKPEISRPTRTGQTLIINGRYVVNSTVSKAVLDAFGTYLMKGQFPFYVLSLSIPLERVDVNVHPNKLDVRFSDSNIIYRLVREAVTRAIASHNTVPSIDRDSISPLVAAQFYEQIGDFKGRSELVGDEVVVESGSGESAGFRDVKAGEMVSEDSIGFRSSALLRGESGSGESAGFRDVKAGEMASEDSVGFRDVKAGEMARGDSVCFRSSALLRGESGDFNSGSLAYDEGVSSSLGAGGSLAFSDFTRKLRGSIVEHADSRMDVALGFKEERAGSDVFELQRNGVFGRVSVVGSLFNTYLIVESGETAYLVDQHAAHERLLFDSFMARVNEKNVSVQGLLIPYVFELPAQDYDLFCENVDALCCLGFSIEPLSARSFKISAVPAQLSGINIGEFVNLLLSDRSLSGAKLGDVIEHRVARNACRAAIKGGDVLSEQDICLLLSAFNESENLRCPHGRPIVLRLTKREIEKWFKRIV